MPDDSDHSEFIRAFLNDDTARTDELSARFNDHGWEGWPEYLGSVFYLAVARRFQGSDDRGDVIQFVADTRIHLPPDAPQVDPVAAEALVGAVVHREPQRARGIDPETLGTVQMTIALKILTDDNLADDELDGLLAEAERMAERFRAERSHAGRDESTPPSP